MNAVMKVVVGLVAAWLAMGAAVASADEGFVGVRGVSVAVGDTTHLAVEGSNMAAEGSNVTGGGGFFVGYRPRQLDGFRFLASFDQQGSSPDMMIERFDGDLQSRWRATRLMAMADWSTPLVGDWLGPLARVGIGYANQRLSLVTDGSEYRGVDHGVSATVAGGLEARIGHSEAGDDIWSRLSLGANVLVGYDWQSRANFDAMEPREANEDWEQQSYDAGSMRVSGISWELGTMVQYRFGK